MARNPNETVVEKEYIFYVQGEITLKDYSEEGAEEQLNENLGEVLVDAVRSEDLEVEGVI